MLSVKFPLNEARMALVIEKRIMSSLERKVGNRNTQGRETEKQNKNTKLRASMPVYLSLFNLLHSILND